MKESTKELLSITAMTFAYCATFGALAVTLARTGHEVLAILAILPLLMIRVKYNSSESSEAEKKVK